MKKITLTDEQASTLSLFLDMEKMCAKYPTKLPLTEVADFLEMNAEGLKAALMRGNAPFGFAYQKSDGAYRVIVIPTVTFYLWYTHSTARQVMGQEVES